jgi:anti-sigma B factor antagonist
MLRRSRGEDSRVSGGPPRTIQLYGELDINTARELGPTLSEAVGDVSRELVVDMRRVTFIDSTLLGALARAAGQLRNQGRSLTLVRTPGSIIDRLLEVSGLSEAFRLVDDPAETARGSTPGPAAAA